MEPSASNNSFCETLRFKIELFQVRLLLLQLGGDLGLLSVAKAFHVARCFGNALACSHDGCNLIEAIRAVTGERAFQVRFSGGKGDSLVDKDTHAGQFLFRGLDARIGGFDLLLENGDLSIQKFTQFSERFRLTIEFFRAREKDDLFSRVYVGSHLVAQRRRP